MLHLKVILKEINYQNRDRIELIIRLDNKNNNIIGNNISNTI